MGITSCIYINTGEGLVWIMDLTSNATNIRASVHIELKLGLCIWSQNWVLSDYVSNDFDYTSLLNCYKWGPPGKKVFKSPHCAVKSRLEAQLGHQIVLWSWCSYLTSFSSYIKWENNSHHRFYHLLGLWEELIIRLRWCLAQNGFGLSFYMCSMHTAQENKKTIICGPKTDKYPALKS